MKRTESGIFIASSFGFLKKRARTRTVTLPSGERAKVTVDDSGTVTHIETDNRLDAIASPETVRLQLRRVQ